MQHPYMILVCLAVCCVLIRHWRRFLGFLKFRKDRRMPRRDHAEITTRGRGRTPGRARRSRGPLAACPLTGPTPRTWLLG